MTQPTPAQHYPSVFRVACPTCGQEIDGYWVYYPGTANAPGRWQPAIKEHFTGYIADPGARRCTQTSEGIT